MGIHTGGGRWDEGQGATCGGAPSEDEGQLQPHGKATLGKPQPEMVMFSREPSSMVTCYYQAVSQFFQLFLPLSLRHTPVYNASRLGPLPRLSEGHMTLS